MNTKKLTESHVDDGQAKAYQCVEYLSSFFLRLGCENQTAGCGLFEVYTYTEATCGDSNIRPNLQFANCLNQKKALGVQREVDLPISHHTGTTTRVLSFHIIELMPKLRLVTNSQAMMDSVGIFLAFHCHGRGARHRPAPVNAPIGSSTCITTTDCSGAQREVLEQHFS